MRPHLFVTTLACLLALGGCLTVTEPLADSDASMPSPGQAGEAATAAGSGGRDGVDGESVDPTGSAGAAGEAALADGGLDPLGVHCQDGTSNPCAAATGPDASVDGPTASDAALPFDPVEGTAGPDGSVNWSAAQFGTRSTGCERLDGTELCLGEGWMLTDSESIPACDESAAYRICTFASGACVSHTVMLVQRCQ